ncbi:MAG: hypothetical protein ABIL68_10325 [bacterium]
MRRGVRVFVLVLFSLALVASFLVTGCSRYANEQQLTTLDETDAAALSAEKKVADLEKEKAELQAKLDTKKQELKKVQTEEEKVRSRL